MYERVSFRSVSKPARIIAPGFVLCAQKFVRRRRCYGSCANDDASGERTAGEEMVSAPAYLGVQPVAEKIPVNFLLFTGKANFALLRVVPEWQPDPTGLDLVRTVSSSAAAACLSSAPGGHPRALDPVAHHVSLDAVGARHASSSCNITAVGAGRRMRRPYEGSSWGKACLAPANERVKTGAATQDWSHCSNRRCRRTLLSAHQR
jgi:hypothetical protein